MDSSALDNRYYSAREAAQYLGLNEKTVRNKALKGEIRYERIAGRPRFRRTWLDAYARSWRNSPSVRGVD